MDRTPVTVFLLLFFVIVFGLSEESRAHGITMAVHVAGETCFVEGRYSKDRRAPGARVEVFDASGTALLEGVTDGEGRFSFKTPSVTDLRIVLTDGLGHRSEFVLPAEQIAAGSKQPPAIAEQGAPAGDGELPGHDTVTIDRSELEAVLDHALDHALDEKLRPLYGLAAELQKRDEGALNPVIAGIGYIFGIAGVAMLLVSARKKR